MDRVIVEHSLLPPIHKPSISVSCETYGFFIIINSIVTRNKSCLFHSTFSLTYLAPCPLNMCLNTVVPSCNILVMICYDLRRRISRVPWSTHDILCLLRVLELNHWTTQRIASQHQKQNIWAWLVSTQPELLKLWLSELLGFTKHWSVRVPSIAALTASAAVWHRFTTALHATERTPNSNRRIKKHVRLDNSNFDQSRSRILSGWIFFMWPVMCSWSVFQI